MPATATRSPGLAELPFSALNTVCPAHSRGAASALPISSGMETSTSAFAVMYSA